LLDEYAGIIALKLDMMILQNKDEQIKNNDILFFWKFVSKCSQKNVGINNYTILTFIITSSP